MQIMLRRMDEKEREEKKQFQVAHNSLNYKSMDREDESDRAGGGGGGGG